MRYSATSSSTFIFIAVLAVLAVPLGASASYTFKGQTFSSKAEYTAFVAEYLRIWRELHGIQESTGTTGADETGATSGADGADDERGTSGADDATSGADDEAEERGTSGADESFSGSTGAASATLVKTGVARDHAHDNARVTGTFDLKREQYGTVWFEYGQSASRLTELSDYQVLRSYGGATHFDARIRGLRPETKYWYRAVLKRSDGSTQYGQVRSLTTSVNYGSKEAFVAVTTDRATNVDDDKALLRARVKFINSDYAYVWFFYGTDPDELYKHTGYVRILPNVRSAEMVLDDLEPNTTYYVRAVAQDDLGTYNYGAISSFTTKQDIVNEPPKIVVGKVTGLTTYSATIAADIHIQDAENATVFLVYGEHSDSVKHVTTAYTRFSDIRERGDDLQKVLITNGVWDDQTVAHTVRDLEPGTRYYYSIGIEYTDEVRDRRLLLTSPKSLTTKSR